MMIATVGFHTGVGGTDAATASKIEEIKLLSPKGKVNVDQQDYKITRPKSFLDSLDFSGDYLNLSDIHAR